MTRDGDDRREVTATQKKARRGRSIAIALALIAFAVIMYVVTIVRMGAGILDRPL